MVEVKQLSDLHGDPKNPRTISKHDFESLKKSIAAFGDLSSIIFNVRTQQLVGGHQRYEAFKALNGTKHIEIAQRLETPDSVGTVAIGFVLLDGIRFPYREVDWPVERQKAANIAANRITGEFDVDLLAEVVYEIQQLDASLLDLTGQMESEVSKLLDSVGAGDNSNEDDAPELDEVNSAVSKLGEIYQLGNHRLMCGSSTDFGDVTELLNGADVHMIFTDPPYNAAFNGRSGNHEVIMNDKLPTKEFNDFIAEFIQTMYSVAPGGVPKYICTDWKMYPLIYASMENPNACIVWVKNMFGMGNTYRHQHEFIVFEGKLEANDQSDVWEIKRDNGAEYNHPTQKPVALPEKAILNSSLRGQNVLDMFGGSGPTLLAAEKTGRNAYIMELDPRYCDVIRKRYAKQTGQGDWVAASPVVGVVDRQTEGDGEDDFKPAEVPEA